MFLKIVCNYGLRYVVFDKLEDRLGNPILASISAASITTLITYPLDLAQGRMQGDMSKKPSLFVAEATSSKNSLFNKPQSTVTRQDRVYPSVKECLKKSEWGRGLRVALVCQVPYQAILLTSFSTLEKVLKSNEQFSRYDDLMFPYKFIIRFGSLTLSTCLASSVCYPLDTIKRRIQLEGSPGYKNTLVRNEFTYAKRMVAEEGWKSLYKGFWVGLCSKIPVCLIQFMVYQNLKFLSGQE